MEKVLLNWRRFDSFVAALQSLRTTVEFKGKSVLLTLPCIYVVTDPKESILRIGQSQDILEEYKGSKYTVEAAMYESGNLVFVTEAPPEEDLRRSVEADLISLGTRFNPQKPTPTRAVTIEHRGDVPTGCRRDFGNRTNEERDVPATALPPFLPAPHEREKPITL